MSNFNINYQQVYEDEVSDSLKESLDMSSRFFDLSNQDRMLVEELVDIGFRRALEDALDPEVLRETALLSSEMGAQLYNFANMLNAHLSDQDAAITPDET